jgi:hypothetical protein
MRKHHIIALLLSSTMLISANTGWAQEAVEEAGEDTATVEDSQKFLDRDRLTETLMADEQAELDAAKEDLEKADLDLADAEDALTDLNEQITALAEDDPARAELEEEAEALETRIEEQLRPAAEDANARVEDTQLSYDEELAVVSTQVQDMPEDTLFAFNRSLNNAVAQGLVVDLDSEEIQTALDGAYDKRQINALTKALEEEAKFMNRAQFFEDKAEETGDERFLEKAERMESRAEAQREKFLARIDRYENIDEDEIEFEGDEDLASDGLMTAEAREEAKEARDEAREAAKEARDEAREAAKEARDEAREAAKEARDEAREAAKEARDDARENAREAASN